MSTLRTAYYQAYREARANGRIGYQPLRSPRARMAAAQVLRNRTSSDELRRAHQRMHYLEYDLVLRNEPAWSLA